MPISMPEQREADMGEAKNNRGFSLIEMIAVVAIITIMAVAGGIGVGMLVGAQAKEVATKLDAQLDDVKTGAMSRAGEVMIIRYIQAPTVAADAKVAAKMGVSKSGYYAVKTLSTIRNSSGIKEDYPDPEYSYLGKDSVKVAVTLSSGDYEISGVNVLKIEFDRASGAIKKAEEGTMDGTAYNNVTYTAVTGGDITDSFSNMTFTSGLRTYTMKFMPLTGKHELEMN